MSTEPRNFAGLRVAAFESRRSLEMTEMLERAGAVPFVSPSMREVPIHDNAEVVDFARRLIDGEFDLVIFMTGVGFRLLLQALEGRVRREDFLTALAGVVTVARGPKPVAAMKEVGLRPNYRVPEPNTWRDILATLDEQHLPVRGSRIAVQEYGLPNVQLRQGLLDRAAIVITVPVYRWEMPEDTEPLKSNLRRIMEGGIDVVLFTSSQQVVHAVQLAGQMGIDEQFRRALAMVVVGSIGPTTSEVLRDLGLPVDIEPPHPKMGHLISEAAARSGDLLRRKRSGGA